MAAVYYAVYMKKTTKAKKSQETNNNVTKWVGLASLIAAAVLVFIVILQGQQISNLQMQLDAIESVTLR